MSQPLVTTRRLLCCGCNETYAGGRDRETCPSCECALVPLAAAELDQLHTTTLQSDPTDRLAAPELDPFVGKEIGVYRFDAVAGRGGMGTVYRGFHGMLQRACAIKVLDPRLAEAVPEYRALFLEEARAAAGLVHPNIVTVHNVLDSDGVHLIEMEWVEGLSLSSVLRSQGRLDPHRATEAMVQLTSALHHAHSRGIIHRDLKPSNALVAEGCVKLADFGLARRVVSTAARQSQVAGTPYFMAPELFSGASADARTDLYAAGITYFYLLTGRLPFHARSLDELVRAHRESTLPSLDELGPAADPARQILEACLAKDPTARWPDVATLTRQLGALLRRLRSLDSLVDEALVGLEIGARSMVDGAIELVMRLAGARTQRVYIEERDHELTGEPLIHIFSPCAPVAESFLRRALELNASLQHGAIAIEELGGRSYFVMRNAYPRATCDPDEVRSSVVTIAEAADDVERSLLDDDRH